MWKLFHPGQKPKTPGRLESGGSFLLSAFLIRGSKQRLECGCAVFAVASSAMLGAEVRPAAACLLQRDGPRGGWKWLQLRLFVLAESPGYEALRALTYNLLPLCASVV